jgi:hypothetical protein
MNNQLEILFSQVTKYGKYVRSNKLDGLLQWNKIKDILLMSKVKCNWYPQVKTIFSYMKTELKIQEHEEDTESHEVWEKHHFYLQHGRIPSLNFNDGTLVRIIQIAYNVGQLEALWDDEFYTQEMKNYYRLNHLNNINSYMDKDNLTILNDSLTNEIIDKLDGLLNDCIV